MSSGTSCSKCGDRAVYNQRYSGQRFCAPCFVDYFEEGVGRAALKDGLVERGDKVGVALSGGKDSMTTLFIMNEVIKKAGVELCAISVDEGISDYREKGLKAAEKYCSSLDIPLHIISFKEVFGHTLDEMVEAGELKPCTYCGVFRRRLLNVKGRELGIDKIATGHNLDDEVQAIMMNYIRGDFKRLVRQGNGSANEGLVRRIKPLKNMPEKEVALYTLIKNLDASLEECPYSRNTFRSSVRDFINDLEERHAGIKYSIMRGYEKILPSLIVSSDKFKACENCGEPTSRRICKSCELNTKLKYD